MFFFYSGTQPIEVLLPSEQYAFRIEPSDRSQKTTNERLYSYLFSDEFGLKHLFTPADSFDPPKQVKKADTKPELKQGQKEALSNG